MLLDLQQNPTKKHNGAPTLNIKERNRESTENKIIPSLAAGEENVDTLVSPPTSSNACNNSQY